jgi:hypothetical protein
MTIDANDPGTLDLDLAPAPAPAPASPTVTVEGWGTGTVAELEHYIDQLRDERDAARHALADLERRTNSPDALAGAELVAVISGIADRAAERAAWEIDGAAIWAEIEYRVEEVAADAARDVIRNELVVNVDLI